MSNIEDNYDYYGNIRTGELEVEDDEVEVSGDDWDQAEEKDSVEIADGIVSIDLPEIPDSGILQIGWTADGDEESGFSQLGFVGGGEQVTNVTAIGFGGT